MLTIRGVDSDIEIERVLLEEYPRLLRLDPSGDLLRIRAGSLSADRHGGVIALGYRKRVEIFRALSLAAERGQTEDWRVEETPCFDSLSLMLNASVCAYLPDYFRDVLRQLALYGYDAVQLYLEDDLEVPGEPYCGHMKGRYTQDELRAMDACAARFGIELIPCVQTLAHLANLFLWPHYEAIRDVDDILLAENEATYAFLENLFRALAAGFSSRKVNIGFDEAHALGGGRYYDEHGSKPREEILLSHLTRVLEIAGRYGFRCRMWSDMVVPFREDRQSPLFAERFPANCDLVYWDYYKTDEADYDRMFARHAALGALPQFAGGAWNWIGMAPANAFGMARSAPALRSCLKNGVREVMLTDWGGRENPLFSVLPALVQYAEFCYCRREDEAHLAVRMKVCSDALWKDFLLLDLPDPPANGYADVTNPGKYLLHTDPISSALRYHMSPDFPAHYRKSARQLRAAARRNPAYADIFLTEAALCAFLELKAALPAELAASYLAKDTASLWRYADTVLPAAVRRLDRLLACYRTLWMRCYKPVGFTAPQRELGALRERLREARRYLTEYLTGKIARIEELEQPALPLEGSEVSTFIQHAGKAVCGFLV